MGNPDDFTIEELQACDWTDVRLGKNGVEYWSGKTGKRIAAPVPSPHDQVMQMRKKSGEA